MLIITNQLTVRVGREGSLSGSGETEEEGDITLLSTDVGRGMERKLAELDGLKVVHDGENTLLHLAGVLGTKDDHFHALEVDFDGRGGAHTLRESVGGELSGIVDDEVGFTKLEELLCGWSDQHVVLRPTLVYGSHRRNHGPNQTYHEKRVISPSANNTDLDPVLGVPLLVGEVSALPTSRVLTKCIPQQNHRRRRRFPWCSGNRWHAHG